MIWEISTFPWVGGEAEITGHALRLPADRLLPPCSYRTDQWCIEPVLWIFVQFLLPTNRSDFHFYRTDVPDHRIRVWSRDRSQNLWHRNSCTWDGRWRRSCLEEFQRGILLVEIKIILLSVLFIWKTIWWPKEILVRAQQFNLISTYVCCFQFRCNMR